jgi:hypothetical protein
MYDRAILVLAAISAMAIASPSVACDMHKSHAELTTASTEPAPLPPVPAPQSDVRALQSVPVAVEEPAQTVSKRYDSGFMGCSRMRKTDQTVYLTN